MSVNTFQQPDYAAQNGSAYPTTIDRAISVLAGVAGAFAVHSASTPDMTVVVDAGRLPGVSGVIEVAQQISQVITSPSSNPRRDIVALNATDGALSIITGTEGVTPADPVVQNNMIPVARINLAVSTTVIDNTIIDDLRPYGSGSGVGQESASSKFLTKHFLENWRVTSGPLGSWESIAYSDKYDRFVAVATSAPYGGHQAMIKSSSGDWVTVPVLGVAWNAVTWAAEANGGVGLFVAVAKNANATTSVMTSVDGSVWLVRSAFNGAWSDICWSPKLGLFVAVSSSTTNQIMTSPDGIAWTLRSSPEANSWEKVVWADSLGLFVAVAWTGTNRVMTSSDGVTWTARAAAEANGWVALEWSADLGLLIAASYDGVNQLMTSSNGVDWTTAPAPANNYWHDLAWSPELQVFTLVGELNAGNASVYTSADGMSWEPRLYGDYKLEAVAWGSEIGEFVAVENSNNVGQIIRSGQIIGTLNDLDLEVQNWDIKNARHETKGAITAADFTINGFDFTDYGHKLITIGASTANLAPINEYSLGEAYDLGSISAEISAGIPGAHNYTDVRIDNAANRLWVLYNNIGGFSGTRVKQFNLTGGSVSNLTDPGVFFDFSAQTSGALAMFADRSMQRLYVLGQDSVLYQYLVNTPKEVSTAVYTGTSLGISIMTTIKGIHFSDDGKYLYVLGVDNVYGGFVVFQYYIASPWDIASASLTRSETNPLVGAEDYRGYMQPRAIRLSKRGDKMFVFGDGFNEIHQYRIDKVVTK